MFFEIVRRGYPYLAHKFALLRAMHWVKVLRKYAKNPSSQKEHLFAIRMLRRWRIKCGLDIREFVKITYKRGYNIPRIMKILTKA